MAEQRPPQHPTRREIRAIPKVVGKQPITREEPATSKPKPVPPPPPSKGGRKPTSPGIADEVTADLTKDPRHDD